MAEYIDRDLFLKNVKHNAPFIYSIVAPIALITPVADVAPVVHGRWIHPKGYIVSNGFLCSECGHEEASQLAINPRPGGYLIADDNGNFFYPPKINCCPNCGARMSYD